jgi:hypothetical protein
MPIDNKGIADGEEPKEGKYVTTDTREYLLRHISLSTLRDCSC